MSSSSRPSQPGHATSSPWNSSGFAFAPNTNVLDTESMPSAEAQLAREKSAQIMAALKSGDTETANALLGKDETAGRILPGMGWLKRKINKRGEGQAKLVGKEVGGGGEEDVVDGKEGKGKKEKGDVVVA